MTTQNLNKLLLFLTLSFSLSVFAQEPMNRNWDSEKIKGTRFLPYSLYLGSPFLNDTWDLGKIQLTSGEIVDSLYLKYSSYKDELIYYNKDIATQIIIDKSILKGFSFTDKLGHNRVFRKLYYNGSMKGDQFFEVLSEGKTDLLVYRNVSLNTTMAYIDESKLMKNLEYGLNYQYYFYQPESGYTSVKTNMAGLFSKFDKNLKGPIKRLLRKNSIRVSGEASFIQAWKVLEKEGYKVLF